MGEEQDSPANTYVHDAHGRLLALVDGHGQRLSRTYDEWGNPVTVTDRNGAVSTTVLGRAVPADPPRRAGRCGVRLHLRRRRPGPVGGGVHRRDRPVPVRGRRAYPRGSGRRRRRSHPAHRRATAWSTRSPTPMAWCCRSAFDADGALSSTTDALGHTARIERDAAGRVAATVTPLGRRTTFDYDDQRPGGPAHATRPAGSGGTSTRRPAGSPRSPTRPAPAARPDTARTARSRPPSTRSAGPAPAGTTRLGNLARLIARRRREVGLHPRRAVPADRHHRPGRRHLDARVRRGRQPDRQRRPGRHPPIPPRWTRTAG